jgi:hypothetical protein
MLALYLPSSAAPGAARLLAQAGAPSNTMPNNTSGVTNGTAPVNGTGYGTASTPGTTMNNTGVNGTGTGTSGTATGYGNNSLNGTGASNYGGNGVTGGTGVSWAIPVAVAVVVIALLFWAFTARKEPYATSPR